MTEQVLKSPSKKLPPLSPSKHYCLYHWHTFSDNKIKWKNLATQTINKIIEANIAGCYVGGTNLHKKDSDDYSKLHSVLTQ